MLLLDTSDTSSNNRTDCISVDDVNGNINVLMAWVAYMQRASRGNRSSSFQTIFKVNARRNYDMVIGMHNPYANNLGLQV